MTPNTPVSAANLAAILTKKASLTTIGSLDDALKANYRICSERKNLETVRALEPRIEDHHIVVDPLDLGGDGLPGFNCPNCAARTRVFEFLDIQKAESGDPQYCHAAFAPAEDLEVEQNNGMHCDKTTVGRRVGASQTGIPVNERSSSELVAYFLKLKNDGVFDLELIDHEPTPNCPEQGLLDTEGDIALSITQLTGIWIVSFGFASIGLLIHFLQPHFKKKQHIRPVHKYDQSGNRVNVLDKDDDWIEEQSVVMGEKRVFLGSKSSGESFDHLHHSEIHIPTTKLRKHRSGGSDISHLSGASDQDLEKGHQQHNRTPIVRALTEKVALLAKQKRESRARHKKEDEDDQEESAPQKSDDGRRGFTSHMACLSGDGRGKQNSEIMPPSQFYSFRTLVESDEGDCDSGGSDEDPTTMLPLNDNDILLEQVAEESDGSESIGMNSTSGDKRETTK